MFLFSGVQLNLVIHCILFLTCHCNRICGFAWRKLVLYLDGNKSKNTKKHVSVYLAMVWWTLALYVKGVRFPLFTVSICWIKSKDSYSHLHVFSQGQNW